MDQTGLVQSIGDSLTQLDTQLVSGDPEIGSAAWQQLYAIRKHLDDQQRSALQQQIDTDDVGIQASIGVIQEATQSLDQAIAQENQIDKVIKVASQISASLDQILKAITL